MTGIFTELNRLPPAAPIGEREEDAEGGKERREEGGEYSKSSL